MHGRPHPGRFHVKGYIEEGTTTTPYELLASNGVSRHDLAIAALRRTRGWTDVGDRLADRYAAEP
jgi:xylulose-5-phosphate/fructose-6-phosphate phosphoketolase